MPILHRDDETRSTLHLPDVGAWKYAGDASTDVWCVSYAVDDGPVQTWTPGQPIPQEFQIAATNSDWLVAAHNDSFENTVEERLLGPRYGWPIVPIERHRCTQAMALAAALPAKLETVAAALNLSLQKDTEGARLMREMARPRKPRPGEDPHGTYWVDDPEKLRRLIAYNVRDVEIERELFRRLPPLSDAERALWVLDAEINRRGYRVDVALAEAAHTIVRERRSVINQELAALTGGRITSIAQVNRIAEYLKERGHKIAGIGKRSVAAILAHGPGDDIERLLRLRQEGGKSSASKLDSLLAMANGDRIHGTLKYHGASTGRWTGHGFQPHNLARAQPADPDAAIAAVLSGNLARVAAIGPPLEIVGSLSRSMIVAAPGKVLISADYSSIEPRVLCWLAEEKWKLDAFRKFDATGDLAFENYCVVASRVLGRTVTPADEEGRQIGKFMELAFGYGGALGAFRKIAPDANFTDAQVETFKRQWRTAHPKIVKFCGDLHRLLLRTVRTRKPAHIKYFRTEMRDGSLCLYLPSGRAIVYPEARIEIGQYDDQIVYKDNAKGKWCDVRGWHGTFAENVTQAVARDALTAAMQRLEAAGYPIVLHVHDEIIAEVAEDFGSPEDFARLMTELPPWAEGLPLAAKGSRRMRYAKNKNGKTADDTPDHDALAELLDDDKGKTAPITPADIEEINAGLRREGIEPLTIETTAADEMIEMASPALADAIAGMIGAMPRGAANINIPKENNDLAGDDYSGSRGDYRDNTSKKLSGKPYTDAHLRRQGYQLAHTFPFELPDGTKLYEERRYELRADITPTAERPRKTCRFCHTVNGADLFDTGPRRIIYNWPAIMRAGPDAVVHITEGASKSAPLNAAGLLATAVAYHQWGPECVNALAGRHLIYHEDHDDNGRKFSADARKQLAPVAASFRIAPIARLFKQLGREPRPHADVKDWIKSGGDVAKLTDICRELPVASTLQSIRASDVSMTAVEWLWPNRFALGKLGLIVGLPEEGKGQVLCYIAAQATKSSAGAWPCDEGYAPKGNVILLTAEDALDDTVAPRLEAAGADRTRIEIVKMVREQGAERMFSLHTDLAMLREKIIEIGDVVLVLIDPISAYLGVGKVDSYRTTDVRAVLGPLVNLAAELKVAMIGIMHFNKKLDVTNVLLRISDSLAYGATARHVYGVVNDPDNHRKLMVRAKNNLAAGGADRTLAFSFYSHEIGIDPNNNKPIVAPFIVWEDAHVDVTAVEAMQAANEFKSPTMRDSARQFLRELLINGPVARSEIDDAAKANGISTKTLFRAKNDLSIIAKKDNSTPDGVWTWRLPEVHKE